MELPGLDCMYISVCPPLADMSLIVVISPPVLAYLPPLLRCVLMLLSKVVLMDAKLYVSKSPMLYLLPSLCVTQLAEQNHNIACSCNVCCM